jgi:thiamine-phosphate pyrophosphorylase
MQLLAVSPESEYRNEADWVVRLLDAGLHRYHVRKPQWGAAECAALIEQIPADRHASLSIHQAYCLAEEYGVAIHLKAASWHPLARSRSLHALQHLAQQLAGFEYAFLSPVFASISKQDYVPQWHANQLRDAVTAPRVARLYALGGITAANVKQVSEFGFDGMVLHGSLWQAADPLRAFQALQKEAA